MAGDDGMVRTVYYDKTDPHAPVTFCPEGEPGFVKEFDQVEYIPANAPALLAKKIASGHGFELPGRPLHADTPTKDILRIPSRIFFTN